MKNIFAKFQEYIKKPNRNTFDLSFYNNLTLKFGQLTPVFCKEVVPGDSFRINTAFGLQLMPMKFPVQTPMRAYVHYFYVRNRTLWKDWMDFICGTKDGLTPPYITPVDKKKFYRVGGLADYFGVPNVIYQGFSDYLGLSKMSDYDITTYGTTSDPAWPYSFKVATDSGVPLIVDAQYFVPQPARNFVETDSNFVLADVPHSPSAGTSLYYSDLATANAAVVANSDKAFWYKVISIDKGVDFADSHVVNMSLDLYNVDVHYTDSDTQYRTFIVCGRNADGEYSVPNIIKASGIKVPNTSPNNQTRQKFTIVFDDVDTAVLNNYRYLDIFTYYNTSSNYAYFSILHNTNGDEDPLNPKLELVLTDASDPSNPFGVIGDTGFESTPYDSDIHLNALPFRAYEAIYNAYYRNPQNNPFILNGTPEYNRYNTTYDGGADSTDYDLYFRNWEYDFLTSAVQSPQQGTAPLVGISVTGEATFQDEDGNTYYAQAILNDQGEITGWQSHSSNMPTGSLRLLMDMAGSGISINDLRNVNAFQRFLENNIRRGLKYRDQLMSHFGVKARYDELDMPEFIGGCSTSINVNKLSQTSESGDTPLGSFVGQASAFGQSKHSITHYCDEHGFIIGIMSVVPVPVYSQLLPKFFVKSQQLDYYFPEFGHIGYQPIQQKEVSPLQTYYASGDLNKVFGYNRAWYDYLASTDEVHAQFRTTMRDFLMNRTFDSEPELSEDFLLVDPDQLNDVFLAGIDDNDLYAPESDKIIGSIYFDVSAKRPIPLFGIPKLTD